MRRRAHVRSAVLAGVLLALLPWPPGRQAVAAPELPGIERAFLRSRDAGRLVDALETVSPALPPGLRALAAWAAGRSLGPEFDLGAGAAADLARAVAALRRQDLAAARQALKGRDPGGTPSTWMAALLHLRRGDDDGAMSRLLAPPLFAWQRDAFGLALLGAALPGDDRRVLAAGALRALERSAARGRVSAVESLTLALAALHPQPGRRAFVFALRTFRRGGHSAYAQRLLASAAGAGIARSDAIVALEVALTAWQAGDWKHVPGLLTAPRPPAGARAAYLALQHARRRSRVVALPPTRGHIRGVAKDARLIARLATALGRPTTPAEVQTWSQGHKTPLGYAQTARAFLSAHGFEVLTAVGDGAAGEALLAAGWPFLLYRILRTEAGYREVPVLVRGFDRRTGLWLLDEPDGRRVDVTPRADVAKARIVCAVPQDRSALLSALRETVAVRLGRKIESALDALDRGAFDRAAARLPAAGAATPAEQVYGAYIRLRAANETREHAWLAEARAGVERSRRTPPLLGIEAYVRGQALGVAGETDRAVGVFENVVRLEGPSATVAMARFAALDVAHDQAGALAAVTEAQRLAPLDSRILYYRAAVRGRAGDFEGARQDLRRALERQPDGLRIALALARLEVMAKRPEVALEVLRDTERRNPARKGDPALRLERRAAEFALLERAQTIEELRWARRSSEPETRRRLAFTLAQREGDGDAAEQLLRLLLADADPEVRASTLRVYLRPWLRARIEQESTLARRISNLLARDKEPEVRRAAASLLGRVSCKVGARALATSVAGEKADAEPLVRSAAARALETHDCRQGRVALVAALGDAALEVRRAAIDALFRLTATMRGYKPEDATERRAPAVGAWQAWLAAK